MTSVNNIIGEKAAIFKYGFLSVKTSKILDKVEKKEASAFTAEESLTIEKADKFLHDIINGQMLIAGEGEFKHSSESVEAVSYALEILNALQDQDLIDKIEELSQIQHIFQKIHDVVSNIHEHQLEDIDNNDLRLSRNFFSWLSNRLVSDAQEIAQLRPKLYSQ